MSENLMLVVSDETKSLNSTLTSLVKSTYSGLEFAEQEMSVFGMIESYLTDERIKMLKTLENKQYGFKVVYAKGTSELPASQFRECMIEAFKRGLIPTGNTFNIIQGKVYTTQEGCKHLLKKMGVEIVSSFYPTSYVDSIGRVIIKPIIKWKLDDRSGTFEQEYVIDAQGNTSEDFRRGKAKRKVLADLIEHITGRPVQNIETEDGDVEVLESKVKVSNPNLEIKESRKEEIREGIKEVLNQVVNDTQVANTKSNKIPAEFQTMFDNFILKADSKEKLISNANSWLISKKAKTDLGVTFKLNLETAELECEKVDLTKYNELLNKFNNPS
jgi:hypothetical protein